MGFTQQEYLWAWAVYLMGAACFMAVVWYLSAKLPWSHVRHVLRIIIGVFLLVPWYSDESGSFLTPAWIVAILEGAFDGKEALWRAGTPLLYALLSTLLLYCLIYVALWYRKRKLSTP